MVETYALTHLAQYTNSVWGARVTESFVRAFGMDVLARVAPVGGGRPGYTIAYYHGDYLTKIVVAIEGMRNPSQLWQAFSGVNSTVYGPPRSRVFNAFLTHANTIYAELAANAQFQTFFTARRVHFVLTGFSLGAAIAEVLSEKFRTGHPTKSVYLVKYGSPRVGNSLWALGPNIPTQRVNYYCGLDPVCFVPNSTMANLEFIRPLIMQDHFTLYQINSPIRRWDTDGNRVDGVDVDDYREYLAACAFLGRPRNESNPWYWHHEGAYRLMVMARVAHQFGEVNESRIRLQYLEYPGDNRFGELWQPGRTDYLDLISESDPPPADYEVPPDVVVPVDPGNPANDRPRIVPPGIMQPIPVVRPQDNQPEAPRPRPPWTPRRPRDF